MTRRAIITGKRVKFCRETPQAKIQVRVFPAVEFRTERLAKRAKVMFEERIREFPAWLVRILKHESSRGSSKAQNCAFIELR